MAVDQLSFGRRIDGRAQNTVLMGFLFGVGIIKLKAVEAVFGRQIAKCNVAFGRNVFSGKYKFHYS